MAGGVETYCNIYCRSGGLVYNAAIIPVYGVDGIVMVVNLGWM